MTDTHHFDSHFLAICLRPGSIDTRKPSFPKQIQHCIILRVNVQLLTGVTLFNAPPSGFMYVPL